MNQAIAGAHAVFLNSEVCINEAVMVTANKVRDCNESKEWLSIWPVARSVYEILCQYKLWHEGEFQQGLVWFTKAIVFSIILIVAVFSYQYRYIKRKIDEKHHFLPSASSSKAIKHE